MRINIELEDDTLDGLKEKISDYYYCWPPAGYGTLFKEPKEKDNKWTVEGTRGSSCD